MQQQQPGQFVSGAAVALDRRNRGANRRSTDTALGRLHSSNTHIVKVGARTQIIPFLLVSVPVAF